VSLNNKLKKNKTVKILKDVVVTGGIAENT
jgi:hypothetical protein